MEDGQDPQDKTEQPTAHRRREAREEGKVAQSKDLSSVAVFFTGFITLAVFGPGMLASLMGLVRETFACIAWIPAVPDEVMPRVGSALLLMIRIMTPYFLALSLVVVIVHVAQTGINFTLRPLVPNFSKLRPKTSLFKVGSADQAVPFLINLIKLLIIGRLGYLAIMEIIPELVTMQDMEVIDIVNFCGQSILKLGLKVGVMFFVLALFDYAFQRWQYEKSLRMTKQDVKDEMKRYEGNPRMKQHMRSLQMQLSRQRMLKQVPEADVVITNPTHFAVAVRYDSARMAAPKVVAKGARIIAERIKALAAEHGVPVVENKPLAQALFKSVNVGEEIPEKLYQAVAELLAYVYQLNRARIRNAAGGLGMQPAS